MESLESFCFICGSSIDFVNTHVRENLYNLKQFLLHLCKLLSITSVKADEWDFCTDIKSSICCESCYELLRNVERLHVILQETERQLKEYLTQVEKLVIKSESQSIQDSLWNASCIKFRQSIAEKAAIEQDENGVKLSPQIYIKEEFDNQSGDDSESRNLDENFDHDWETVKTQDFDTDISPSLVTTNEKTNTEAVDAILSDVSVKEEPLDEQFNYAALAGATSSHTTRTIVKLKRSVGTKGKLSVKKQKIVIFDNETEDPVTVTLERRSSKRVAKKCAKEALKRYALNVSDEDDDHNSSSKDSKDERQNFRVWSEADVTDGESNDEELPSTKSGKTKGDGEQKVKKMRKGEFYPFVVAEDNLYLYRWGTFVRYTYTHLKCLAHDCKFETAFDYFPSFQIMKTHINENHRDQKHRQRTPHPCHLCNKLCKTQDEFRKHIKKAHHQVFGTHSKAICECCLMYTRHCYARTHLFNHKNEEEKAAARAVNDGSTRNFKPKESEMTEKNYKCDYENCTSSFKSGRNLRRHKQVHLPLELRTDQTICPECGKQMLKECLATHMRRIHHPEMADRVLICPICDKRYLTGDGAMLQKHIRQHKGDRPFLCTECGRSYVGNAELIAHVNQVHRDEDPITCEWCDQVYTKPRSLQKHIMRKHPDKYKKKPSLKKMSKFYYTEAPSKADFIGPIQQFPCPVCETICKYRSTLKKHMKLHSSDTGNHAKNVRTIRTRVGPSTSASKTFNESSSSADAVSTNNQNSSRKESEEDSTFPTSSSLLFPSSSISFFGQS